MLSALTLDQLRILVTGCDGGSFSAAGRQLGRAHSAISQSVQTLEATQGVQLFDRSTKTPKLTEPGRVMVAQERQVLRQAETLESVDGPIDYRLVPVFTMAVHSFVP